MRLCLFMLLILLSPFTSLAENSFVSKTDEFKATFYSDPKLNKLENKEITIRNYKSEQMLGDDDFFVQDITVTCAGNNKAFRIPDGKVYSFLEGHLRGSLMIYLSQSKVPYNNGERFMFKGKYKALKYHIRVNDRGFNLTGIIFLNKGRIYKVGTAYTDYFLDNKKTYPSNFINSFELI